MGIFHQPLLFSVRGSAFMLIYLVPGLLSAPPVRLIRSVQFPSLTTVYVGWNSMSINPNRQKIFPSFLIESGCVAIPVHEWWFSTTELNFRLSFMSYYLANWHHIHTRRHKNILYDNARENRQRIDYDYKVGDFVYVLTKAINRKLAPTKQGPFRILTIHTNATVTIRRSARVAERINIRRLFPAHIS